jgi:hypothetical protein
VAPGPAAFPGETGDRRRPVFPGKIVDRSGYFPGETGGRRHPVAVGA